MSDPHTARQGVCSHHLLRGLAGDGKCPICLVSDGPSPPVFAELGGVGVPPPCGASSSEIPPDTELNNVKPNDHCDLTIEKCIDSTRILRQKSVRRYQVKKYGITFGVWQAILDAQGGTCAVCGTSKPTRKGAGWWHTDHEHTSGTVRGILCLKCNVALGHLGDTEQEIADSVARLLVYLREGVAKTQAVIAATDATALERNAQAEIRQRTALVTAANARNRRVASRSRTQRPRVCRSNCRCPIHGKYGDLNRRSL